MAYLYVNPDGITRPYSTIADAMTSASGGDTLVLDPGLYAEEVIMSKEVNIRGNTQTPENDDIIIDPWPTKRWPAINISRILTSVENIHIEGVTLRNLQVNNHNLGVFEMMTGQSASKYLNLIFNRCRFLMFDQGSSYTESAIHLGNTYIGKAWFDHCEWDMTGNGPQYEFYAARWADVTDSRVIACVYSSAYSCQSCYPSNSGPTTVHNYVTTPTEGYGPSYSSDWYIPLDYPVVGYFDGYVMEEGSPVQRTINLYKRTNGEFLGTTSSNPSGYYYIETTFSGMHYVVALDAPADPLYNDLIIGSAYPTAL